MPPVAPSHTVVSTAEPRAEAQVPEQRADVRVIKYVRPWMYAKQKAAIFCTERYGVIEASTKAGKTWGCLCWLAEQALIHGKAGWNYWWVSPGYGQSKIAFRRLKRALPRALYVHNEGELTITLLNGTIIWFKSGDNPDALYGEDVHAAVIDEASRVKEDAWHAVRSTLTATKGPIRLIGNVKGRKNWFYRLARKAEAGEPDMHYSKLTYLDAIEGGIMSSKEVEDARRVLPERVFKELFSAEASDDDGNPFGAAAIEACIVPRLSNKPPAVWGWDLAKKHDWCVGIALDNEGMVCRFERFQSPWQITIDRIVKSTMRTPALVDSTGAGDPVLESLQTNGRRNFVGFTFTKASKQKLMEGLAVAIQQSQVAYPADTAIVQELEVFEYQYTANGVRYSAPEGLHDDCVCALALAVQMRSNATRHRSGAAII